MDPELLDKLEKLQVLTLQPGDVLVATVTRGLAATEQRHRIKEQLQRYVPHNDVIVICDMELAALRQPQPRPAPTDQSWLQMETS